ncbi:hypothetical protein FVF58_09355 [Paraburkholderia panacisoli]|uniref:Uncharacterized protein n=2 Tax=Paraburkholderia panacisoli TaxID=2603818 RepID=A0A5B0HDJ0_9BURK|nr:hypothetical protein FVF58_09355 [Paraburkholderia panacisoli]
MPSINLGLTARDYFIAHAPAEPQPWFKPVMPPPPPSVQIPAEMTDEERNEYYGWDEYLGIEDMKCPRIRDYCERVNAHRTLAQAWNSEFEKQHYVQWPAAWADAMLRARGAE